MAMWRARYGDQTTSSCPLCGRTAIVRNAQGMPVCTDHKNAQISASCPNCRASLDLRDGKFGKFYLCDKCGPISTSKAVVAPISPTPTSNPSQKTESAKQHPMMGDRRALRANAYKNADGTDKFIRSDDPRFEFR